MQDKGQIQIYKTSDGHSELEVTLEKESVWLSLTQMVELFQRDKSVISRHLKNIFKEKELHRNAVVAKNATTASDGKIYQVEYYNLDVIISIGYRVKSKRGTQFRIWANKVLKDYLIKGYAINEKHLKVEAAKYRELQQSVKLLQNVISQKAITATEAKGLLEVITDYAYALDILDRYDHQQLKVENTSKKDRFQITYKEAIKAIDGLKKKFGGSDLFGREKDESFKSSLNTIYQTFDSKELYPSIEEKAANLLYFVVKNHSFSDGNKRIAAFLFVWFLDKNNYLYSSNGTKRIADNALVAITLMIAQSKPDEKEIIVKVVINLINKQN